MSQINKSYPSVFNPGNQTDNEIVSNFVIRLPEFNDLSKAIKKEKMTKPPQHYMIQAQRGYGKTTLLLRLNIEIKNNRTLKKWLVPVLFDEEQYRVRSLVNLWEEIIETLADENESFQELLDKMESLSDKDFSEENVFNLLIKELVKLKKKILVLIDNFGDMIQKFTRKENQRLREVLITCNKIRFIGASSTVLEFYYNYKEPFYDFFKVISLEELNRNETIQLLKQLGETYKSEEIFRIIENQPERIDALRQLTGGVPRTIVMLYKIFVDEENGDSFNDLEMLLDKVTPLYKHRLDNLSKQQQVIIDAIAQNWDAINTKEIAAKTRMQSKAVSAQLKQLENSQLIKKIPTSTKNFLYQINERFFNIYYLMRLGKRKNRNRVLWFVKFLLIWCDIEELIKRTEKHIEALKSHQLDCKFIYFMSESLARTPIPIDLQDRLIKGTRKVLVGNENQLENDISLSHLEVLEKVKVLLEANRIPDAMRLLINDGMTQEKVYHFVGEYFREIKQNYILAKKYFQLALETGEYFAYLDLALINFSNFNDITEAAKNLRSLIDYTITKTKNILEIIITINHWGNKEFINILDSLYAVDKKTIYLTIKSGLLVLQNIFVDGIDSFELALKDKKFFNENPKYLIVLLSILIAQEQYQYLLNKFNKSEISRKKYSAFYFAVLKLSGEKYKDKYNRVPTAMKDIADEVIDLVEELRALRR